MPVARTVALLLLCALAGAACAKAPDPGPDPRAKAAFDRTKRTQATYALYSWNWVKGSGFETGPHWSAEFHRSSLHRVETPHVRIVADCAAGTGTMLQVNSGKTESSSAIAGAACGINSNFPIRDLEWLGRKATRFGPVDLLRVLDPADERIYAVDQAGALVASEIFPRDKAAASCLQQEPLAVERVLPAEDMFTVGSLKRSFAAVRFQSPPNAYSGDLWLGTRRCISVIPDLIRDP
jgi:hypothetical protein